MPKKHPFAQVRYGAQSFIDGVRLGGESKLLQDPEAQGVFFRKAFVEFSRKMRLEIHAVMNRDGSALFMDLKFGRASMSVCSREEFERGVGIYREILPDSFGVNVDFESLMGRIWTDLTEPNIAEPLVVVSQDSC